MCSFSILQLQFLHISRWHVHIGNMSNVVIAQAWRSQVGGQMSRLNWSEWSWWVEVEVESLIGESWLVKLGLHPPTIHKPQLPHFASFNNHPAPSPPSHPHIHTLLLPSSTIPTIHKPQHHPAPPISTIYGLTTSYQTWLVSPTQYSVIVHQIPSYYENQS